MDREIKTLCSDENIKYYIYFSYTNAPSSVQIKNDHFTQAKVQLSGSCQDNKKYSFCAKTVF